MKTTMGLDETTITRCILKKFTEDFLESLDLDVSVVGGGPAGLTASIFLAKARRRVAIFERHPYCGGGLLSGGMLLPRVVVTDKTRPLLRELGASPLEIEKGCYVVDSVELASKLTSKTVDSGARIWNNAVVEDVVIRKGKVEGVVINWTAVKLARLHVDPLTIKSKVVIDATGHDAEVARIVERKIGARLPTKTGGVVGEKSMWTEVGEKEILDNAREIYPGLVMAGIAANAVFGSPRMGAIFDGMLLSGKRAAEVALTLLRKK